MSASRLVHACLLAAAPALAGASGPGADFALEAVAEGVWVHEGAHASVQAPGREDIANLGFVVGEQCVAVIDTGGSIRIGERLLAAVRRTTDVPVCYVINTHVHFDHVLGNAAFAPADPTFLGHARLAEAIAASRAFFVEQFARELGGDPDPARVVGPDRLVENRLELDLGGRVLELVAHPEAHTGADLTVLDRASGILFAGDLVFIERAPALDGSIRGWHEVLEGLRGRAFTGVVPGHGPALAPWPAGSDDQLRYLEVVLEGTRAAIARGAFMERAVETVGRGERGRWRLFEENHGRNVTRAFAELEWE